MSEVTIALGGNPSKSVGGTDVEDLGLHAAIPIADFTYLDANDRVYDMRGVAKFGFSITNEDGANALTWRLQQTEDPVPADGDMAGATWVDIDAEASLAAGITAKKDFTKTSLLTSAIRLQVRETSDTNDASYIGRMVMGNYL